MAADCSDGHVLAVRLTGDERPIICLQNALTLIAVAEAEQPPFALVRSAPNLTGQRAVQYIDMQFTPPVDLKHAARRPRRQDRHVRGGPIERILRAVEAPLDVREAEIREQTGRNTIALDRGECRVSR